jgi:hypothetical protein
VICQKSEVLTEVGWMGLAAFGAPGAGAFGQQQQNGTRTIPFQRVQEVDGSSSTGSKTPVYLQSISAMQPYSNKSFEELRWEDYQVKTVVRNAPYSCSCLWLIWSRVLLSRVGVMEGAWILYALEISSEKDNTEGKKGRHRRVSSR